MQNHFLFSSLFIKNILFYNQNLWSFIIFHKIFLFPQNIILQETVFCQIFLQKHFLFTAFSSKSFNYLSFFCKIHFFTKDFLILISPSFFLKTWKRNNYFIISSIFHFRAFPQKSPPIHRSPQKLSVFLENLAFSSKPYPPNKLFVKNLELFVCIRLFSLASHWRDCRCRCPCRRTRSGPSWEWWGRFLCPPSPRPWSAAWGRAWATSSSGLR